MRASAEAGIAGQGLGRGMRRRAAAAFAPAALVLVAVLAAAPASAKQTHLFIETFGSAAQPEFRESSGLAIDRSSGDLLVVDIQSESRTLSRFKPNGEPDPFSALGTNVIDAKKGPGAKACGEEPASCDQTPHNGFEMGNSAAEVQIAIDNSGTITDGDIYVTQGFQSAGNVVDVFAPDGHYLGQLTAAGATKFGEGTFGPCGAAVDSAGNLYLGGGLDKTIYKFTQPLSPHNPLENADGASLATNPKTICSLAAGAGPSAGALFAASTVGTTGAVNSIFRLDAASGALLGAVEIASPDLSKVIAVDPVSGHVFSPEVIGPPTDFRVGLREFSASGTLVSTSKAFGNGVAIDGATGRIYVSSSSLSSVLKPTVKVFGPLLTLPDVLSGAYEIEGDTAVRVKGSVDPDGQALSECYFEYETDAARKEHPSKPFEGATTQSCEAPNAAEVGSGKGAVEVHADLTELGKETLYHYRLLATNANAALYPDDPEAVVKGSDQSFKTPAKPGIKELWASDVLPTEAGLDATLSPENSPTTYRFEYGDQGPCDANPCTSVPAPPAPESSLGKDGADHTVGIHLGELEPATTYHYRIVATNGIGKSESTDRRFRTFATPTPPSSECGNEAFRIGFGALLPDCRAYEMVSPVDKGGGDIRLIKDQFEQLTVLEQASDTGERLAYGSYRAFGDASSSSITTQYIAQRIAGAEWQTHAINPPRGRNVVGAGGQFSSEFKLFSADLCEAWLIPFGDSPFEGGVAGFRNLYRRGDRLCGAESYVALAPIETPVGFPAAPIDPKRGFGLELQDVSADGAQAIFVVNGKLAAGGSEEGRYQLYESSATGPRLVCVLPSGQPWSGDCQAGTTSNNGLEALLVGGISEDGSRVFWADSRTSSGRLYVRQNPAAPESARLHGLGAGKGDLIGPAAGTGNVASGSELVKGVKAESGAFAVGQEVSDSNGGIPAKATIKAIEETAPATFTLTLSAKATKTKLADTLSGAASEKVAGLATESGAFAVGQEISAGNGGIPAGTTVLACSPSCGPGATALTLSAKASKTGAGAAIVGTSECTEAATKACTFPVSEAAEKEAVTSSSTFWGASGSGDKAIFTTGSLATGAKLYSFEPDSETTTLLAEGVLGVMGISESAERVYFASEEAIAGSGENSEHRKAEAGKPNLYLYEAGGGTSFIATLATADVVPTFSDERYGKRSSRVTPDGAHAVFTSVLPLSGYDNVEASTACGNTDEGGNPCPETYRYDGAAKQLTCVSCNPSGGRPAGPSSIPIFESPVHGARVLADDGTRLYFESADALVPRDTNGATDVYQWEEAGTGPPGAECEESLPTYSPENEGCIDLLSTGQSRLESRFVESSPTGENVFFATASGFLPQDPGGVDIYDARALGGLPIPAGPAPGCEGEACQSPPAAPEDPTPASAAFEGAGNLHEEASPTPSTPRCAKGKVRRHGKCVVKKHKRAHKRAKRQRRAGR